MFSRLLAVFFCLLIAAGCGANQRSYRAADDSTTLTAEVFQEHWEGGGGTLLIRSLNSEIVWQNRVEIEPGSHEAQFQYETTIGCAAEKGCTVRRYQNWIAFDAEPGKSYKLRAWVASDGALHAEIRDVSTGERAASLETRQSELQQANFPNEAWRSLCGDAEMGDTGAQRAIGLHYWHGWWPARRNPVLAYQWLSIAMLAHDSAAPGFRRQLMDEMTNAQIDEAERRLAAWQPGLCVAEAQLS